MKVIISLCLHFLWALPLTWVNGDHCDPISGQLRTSADYPQHPCQDTNKGWAYALFRNKHVLRTDFDTNDKRAWGRYLYKNSLCRKGKTVQTFFQKKDELAVRLICSYAVAVYNNICQSDRRFVLYTIEVRRHPYSINLPCFVTSIKWEYKMVMVRCDKYKAACLPVEFEGTEHAHLKPCPGAPRCH